MNCTGFTLNLRERRTWLEDRTPDKRRCGQVANENLRGLTIAVLDRHVP